MKEIIEVIISSTAAVILFLMLLSVLIEAWIREKGK
jgi:hypothetical protein